MEFNNAFDDWLNDKGKEISSNACSVMRYLISKSHNKTGIAFPSGETIVLCTRLSKASVFRSLNELEKLELIIRVKRENLGGFKRNEYKFLLRKKGSDMSVMALVIGSRTYNWENDDDL